MTSCTSLRSKISTTTTNYTETTNYGPMVFITITTTTTISDGTITRMVVEMLKEVVVSTMEVVLTLVPDTTTVAPTDFSYTQVSKCIIRGESVRTVGEIIMGVIQVKAIGKILYVG